MKHEQWATPFLVAVQTPVFTPEQKEILLLTYQGKGDSEISLITGIPQFRVQRFKGKFFRRVKSKVRTIKEFRSLSTEQMREIVDELETEELIDWDAVKLARQRKKATQLNLWMNSIRPAQKEIVGLWLIAARNDSSNYMFKKKFRMSAARVKQKVQEIDKLLGLSVQPLGYATFNGLIEAEKYYRAFLALRDKVGLEKMVVSRYILRQQAIANSTKRSHPPSTADAHLVVGTSLSINT